MLRGRERLEVVVGVRNVFSGLVGGEEEGRVASTSGGWVVELDADADGEEEGELR